jgi:integrase
MLSPDTVMTYARAIELWRRSLDAGLVAWDDINSRHLVRWRDAQLKAGVDPKTVNLRLTAVAEFYRWCHEEGLFPRVPVRVSSHKARRGSALAVRERTGGGVTKAREKERRKDTFTDEQFLAVKAANPRSDYWLRVRDDSMFGWGWGWGVGIRRSEIVALTLAQIARCLRTARTDPDYLLTRLHRAVEDVFVLALNPSDTKGGKGGDVLVPRRLLKQTLEWAANGRAQILQVCRGTDPSQGRIFVGIRGKPIPRETLTRTFSMAARRAGVKGRLHATRHSFATRLIIAAERLGSTDGLRLAKELLRHSDERTTQGYAHLIESRQDRVVMAMLVSQIDAEAIDATYDQKTENL